MSGGVGGSPGNADYHSNSKPQIDNNPQQDKKEKPHAETRAEQS